MDGLRLPHDEARGVFLSQLDRFHAVVGAMDDHDLLRGTRCLGWTVLDAVVHVRVGLQEMLTGSRGPG